MKTNKFMIASLLILVGMGALTVSCKKEEVKSRKAQIIVENDPEKTGGDHDPIIRVRVKKKYTLVAVDSAGVETYEYGTNQQINHGYTNSSGEYDREVASGIYYFRVTAPGGEPLVTDTVHVHDDVQVTVLVD
ncbi:hypothetical protein [Fluviicola sp.]|uniref:hypothetical protein n=1 Tax=Fluviicola sp. TaxID=1917219 RepID=UPI0031DF7B65